jgi:hypothetical protein
MGRRVVLACLPLLLLALHRPGPQSWWDAYTDHVGVRCCGVQDCLPVVARMVADGDPVLVQVQGWLIEVPRQSIHLSETPGAWICLRAGIQGEDAEERACTLDGTEGLPPACVRCVFLAVGT